jgi:integrase/recombinase XerD
MVGPAGLEPATYGLKDPSAEALLPSCPDFAGLDGALIAYHGSDRRHFMSRFMSRQVYSACERVAARVPLTHRGGGRSQVSLITNIRPEMHVMPVIFLVISTTLVGLVVVDRGEPAMSAVDLCLTRSRDESGDLVLRVGMPLVDAYLEFLGGRCRPNTVLAAGYDLKVFFTVVAKPPGEVGPGDVLAFITAQRTGRVGEHGVLQSVDRGGELAGVSTSTVRRRLSIVSGFFAFLQVRGDVAANPVPRGLPTRRERSRPRQGVPLVRATRRLPQVLSPAQVDALTAALRTHRDRAMVAAMVLAGLRRCEVLGLRLEDLRVAERRVFIVEGKGGRQRVVPVSARFFSAVADYLNIERPARIGTDKVFVALKGPRRGQPLSAKGLDEVLVAARRRAGLAHASCHELRHTCLTRLREAGMALEAVQAQAGHASIESTRIYLHLADDWLAGQYRKAAEVIDAQVFADKPGGSIAASNGASR